MNRKMLVELKNIRKVFGEVVALNDIDFSIEKGAFTASWEKTAPARPPS